MPYVTNRASIEKAVRASMARFERTLGARIQEIVRDADLYIKSLTPVHSGSAVRNYIWTMDDPFTGKLDAIESGPPGPTNQMPLGPEPRRSANESAAAASISTLDFRNPFGHAYILSNNDPDIRGLELGLLPGEPLKSRSPNGMFGLTHEYIMVKVRARGFQ
jgi:hypothetical protein